MSIARFNHMELTLPPGGLDARAEISEFYRDLFGWESMDVYIVKQNALLLRTDPETSQFILLTEMENHIRSPGYDHLGLLYPTRAEVDEKLEIAKKWRDRDPRVQIKEYEDLVTGDVTTHAFYVKHLLPIWLDVQCQEHAGDSAPRRGWSFG